MLDLTDLRGRKLGGPGELLRTEAKLLPPTPNSLPKHAAILAHSVQSNVRPGVDTLHRAAPSGLTTNAETPGRTRMVHPGVSGLAERRERRKAYSHSMVPGGFDVTSSTTRLTSGTWLVILFEMRASTSYGTRVQSAVIASSEDTGRSTMGWP